MKKIEEIIKFIEIIKADGVSRKIDELGRIVIPIQYRELVEEEKTKVNIFNIGEYVIVEILDNQLEDTNMKFDKLGRVAIGIEIRDLLDWKTGDEIRVWNYEKYFILKKIS